MSLPRAVRRRLRWIGVDGNRPKPWPLRYARPQGRPRRSRFTNSSSPAFGVVPAGTIGGVQWGERGLEMSPGAAVAVGLLLFAGVAVVVAALTGGRPTSGGGDSDSRETNRNDVEPAADADTETLRSADHPPIPDEGARVALFREDGDWIWRVFHLEALGESSSGAATQSAATARIERVQEAADGARVRELTEGEEAFRVYTDADGRWQWDLIRTDGHRVGTNATEYDERGAATEAVAGLQDHGPDSDCIAVERAAFAIDEHHDGWYWRLVDDEREPLAESADGYGSPDEAERAAERVAEEMAAARFPELEAETDEPEAGMDGSRAAVGIELYEPSDEGTDKGEADSEGDTGGNWSWRVVDDVDEVVADGTTAFDGRKAAEDEAMAVLESLEEAAVTVAGRPAYERYRTDASDRYRWRWRLVDETDRVVARSTGADSETGTRRAVDRFAEAAPDAPIRAVDGAVYEVHPATGDGETDADRAAAEEGSRRPSEHRDSAPEADGEAVADGAGLEVDDADSGASTTDGRRWRWRLVVEGRDVVAASPRAYDDPETATETIDRIRAQAADAEVTEFESAAFRVYESAAGEWRWRLLDERGALLADSTAEHDTRNEAAEAMVTLKEQAPDADVIEIETAAFELFASDGEWCWRLIDSAGRCVAEAPSTYPDRAGAREALDRVRDHLEADARTMDGPVFEPYVDGDWYWRFVLPTGEPLAVAASGRSTRDDLLEGLSDLRETAATAQRYSTGATTVQLSCSDGWRWRVLDRDRDTVVESAGVYADREAARRAVDVLERTGTDAPVFTAAEPVISLERIDGTDSSADTAGESEGEDRRCWRWRLLDADRNEVAVGTESLARATVPDAIEEIRRLAPQAERIDVSGTSFDLVADDGRWRWRFLDEGNTPIATGTVRYESKGAARAAIDEVRDSLESANVFELEGGTFELYEGGGEWGWRLVDGCGETLLESTETYETRAAAHEALAAVRTHTPHGEVTVVD
ncbi:hypothetical protein CHINAEXTREME_10525 [Halobiforma lacisalsi AJ5]|uniref:DUF1508 domain-containing protein n=1 Tax=Natronobacterium lacisalsi AJ5 TaxID=358396 RepID=A0A1P8LQX2_NATLA|nr:YegP family protein [Halobiforma lacisalsi]APW98197.1 hypothetical protein CHINAEXTREME_10525 [Halobiforma lacisalsi AJ5]